jgi:hypothetical protein
VTAFRLIYGEPKDPIRVRCTEDDEVMLLADAETHAPREHQSNIVELIQ